MLSYTFHRAPGNRQYTATQNHLWPQVRPITVAGGEEHGMKGHVEYHGPQGDHSRLQSNDTKRRPGFLRRNAANARNQIMSKGWTNDHAT